MRKDKKQTEKEQIVTSIQATDNKIKRSKSKNEISKLRKSEKSNRTLENLGEYELTNEYR